MRLKGIANKPSPPSGRSDRHCLEVDAMFRSLLFGGFLFMLLAGAQAQVPPLGLPAFRHKAVVVDYHNLKYNPCNDAMFPCVIEAAKYFKKPLARFYMYYAPHNAPGGICLATADSPAGPWKEYPANPVITRDWAPHYKVSHVCSAHAIWNEEEERLFIYFHGENNVTRYATTTDGIHCTYGGVAVTAAMFDKISEASYARVFRHEIPGTGSRYIMLFMGNNRGTRRIYLAWSRDGRQWTARCTAVIDPPPGTSQVASPFLFAWHGKSYVIYHGEEMTKDPNRPHCNLYVSEVDAALEHPRLLGKFFDRAGLSPTNGRAADGDIIEVDGKPWLFYSTDERLNQRIAVAELKPSGE
jgi:hypothetical protein